MFTEDCIPLRELKKRSNRSALDTLCITDMLGIRWLSRVDSELPRTLGSYSKWIPQNDAA
jgi:hypothetical protein